MRLKKEYYLLIIFGVLIIGFLLSENSNQKSFEESKRYNKSTIAFSTRFEKARRSKNIVLYFYFKGERKIIKKSAKHLSNEFLNKYFEIRFNNKDISEYTVLIENGFLEPDSITLINSGFKLVEKSIYNISTGKYDNYSEWE